MHGAVSGWTITLGLMSASKSARNTSDALLLSHVVVRRADAIQWIRQHCTRTAGNKGMSRHSSSSSSRKRMAAVSPSAGRRLSC